MNDKLKHLIAGLVIGVTTVTVALLLIQKDRKLGHLV